MSFRDREDHAEEAREAQACLLTSSDEDVVALPVLPMVNDEPARWSTRARATALNLAEVALLAAIVGLAVSLRFRGIEWGTGYFLHPDELFMTSVLVNLDAPTGIRHYFDSATSPLNPFNHGTGFIYGTFPLFAAKVVQSFTNYTDVSTAHIPGRWLSAAADTGTVVFAWWIGRMLWNRAVGLLAALLLACTALNIGAAHYFTTDAWSAFFATGAFAFVIAGWQHRRWLFYALAGVMVGLAAASKPNLLAAFGFLLLPVLEAVRLGGWRSLMPRWSRLASGDEDEASSFPVLLATALAVFAAVWTIRIAQPYSFLGPSVFSFRFDPRWVADVEYWRDAQSGELDYPPGIQWADRAPIWFHLKNMILWGMGPGLAISALGGLAWQLWGIVTARRWPSWLMLGMAGWICFHIVYFGISLAKTQRYLMPAYPMLVVLAAAVLVAAAQWAWGRGRIGLPGRTWSLRLPRWCHPGVVLPLIAVGSTVFYGVAFTSVYTEPQTRAEASRWIAANVPDGSAIVNEYWDLGLPVGVDGIEGHFWNYVQIHPYADETPEKVTAFVGTLQRADYIVLSSARLVGTIPRMAWRYPLATRYYEALYSGELGFEQVAHFTSYPELFGIEIDDRSAEEALTVYDHPEVTIFRKTANWDAHDAWYLLNDALGHGGVSVRPVQTQPQAMMLDPAGQEDVGAHASWGSVFDAGSIANRVPVIAWYVALQVLVLPVVPILWRLLPWLPDRGYALAKTIGLFGVGWLTWWVATLGLLDFGPGAIAAAWLAVFAGGLYVLWRYRDELFADLAARRAWLVATEILFLGAYLTATWVRAANPDLWGHARAGSHLQDMATFNAMVRTPSFPAYDPWLVDGVIHDFTFGYVPWAVVTRLSTIAPEVAWSLALATLPALVAVNGWLAASVLVARFRPGGNVWRTIAGGLLAPLFLLAVGSWGMAQRVGGDIWSLNYDGSVRHLLPGLWRTITGSPSIPEGAWLATDTYPVVGTLEFPLLTYLTGELAVQQLALPLLLAGAALLFGFLAAAPAPGRDPYRLLASLGGWREAAPFLVVAGIVTGWTTAANPLFGMALGGLSGVLLVLATGVRVAWGSTWAILRDTGVAIVVIGAVAGLAVAPFVTSYGYFDTKRLPLLQPLSVDQLVGHLGVVLAVTVGYLLWQVWGLCGDAQSLGAIGWGGAIACGALTLAALALAFLVGSVSSFLLVLVLVIGFAAWYRHAEIGHLLMLGTIAVALGLGLVANRMSFLTWTPQENIPAQFSLAMWLLLAVVAGPMVVAAWTAAWEGGPRWRMAVQRLAAAGMALAVATWVAVAAVYPVLALPQRSDERLVATPRTLDSFAFMNGAQLTFNANGTPVGPYDLSADLAAVEWLRDNVTGLPTILEAPATAPGWGGRVSALTGYPAVIGSVPVAKQQRPGMERLVDWRYQDVTTAFGATVPFAEIEPILRDYGVQLIYVGPLERVTYGPTALAKFDEAAAAGELQVLYQQEGVTIYFYNKDRDPREYRPS